MRQKTLSLRWIAALAAFGLALASPAFGAADVLVTVINAGVDLQAEVILRGPNGVTTSARDDDGDGTFVVEVPGKGGEHEVTLTLGEVTARRTVSIPASGQLTLLFDSSAQEKIQVAYAAGNEDVYVTARRREESLQQTPLSITAFTAQAIEERSMRDISDLGDFTPNLTFATTSVLGGSGNHATVNIRGLGRSGLFLWSDPAVGTYLDGVFVARTLGGVLDLVDVERVEVLRGPQGTLFGKNTMGGALNVITRRPDSEFVGQAELIGGSFDRADGSMRLSGALSERLFASLAASSTNADGFAPSLYNGDDYFDDNTNSIRAALRAQPSENVTVDWTADSTRQREHGAPIALVALDLDAPLVSFFNDTMAAAGLETMDERWVVEDFRQHYAADPNISDSDVVGTSLDVHWLIGRDLSWRSITSYRELDLVQTNDWDGTPVLFVRQPRFDTQEQWSEEVQLSGVAVDDRLTWVVGGLYFQEEGVAKTLFSTFLSGVFEPLESLPGPIISPPGAPAFLCNPGPPPPGVPCFGGAGNPLNLIWYDDPDDVTLNQPSTVSYALFSESTFDLSDRLALTVGLRLTREDKEFLFTHIPDPGAAPDDSAAREATWERATPRASLAFQARPSTMLYLTAANGFMSGGFNGIGGLAFLDPFGPEEVWSYEAGLKTDLFQNRLRINTALFWSDYTGLQLTTLIEDTTWVVSNAGTAEIKGFEIELQAQLSDSFRIDGGVGYTDTEYTDLPLGVADVTLEGKIPLTPEWSVVISPELTRHLRRGDSITLRADYSYKSKYFNDLSNSEIIAQEGFSLINARASWILPSGAWEAFAYGTNLTDELYKENAFLPGGLGVTYVVAGRPREWGVGLKYRF